jgi:hypothetical protein
MLEAGSCHNTLTNTLAPTAYSRPRIRLTLHAIVGDEGVRHIKHELRGARVALASCPAPQLQLNALPLLQRRTQHQQTPCSNNLQGADSTGVTM